MIHLLPNLLLIFMMTCAVFALFVVKDLLAGVILFGAFSFFSAMLFAVLGAVDVAFTEAAVGAAITTIFFVTALQKSTRKVKR